MDWKWTEHIKIQLGERKISKELVEMAINNPDEIVDEGINRKVYQKIIGDKLIRVVTEETTLITAYLTKKIRKYYKRG
ncbi:MAG: DUF4258 domain-containing protein [bacterium]